MGSELIFRGHEAQPVHDAYSPKPNKPWLSVTRPIHYMLREQRLLFVLLGVVIATVFFTLVPSSSNSSPTVPYDPLPISYFERERVLEPKLPAYHRVAAAVHSVGKVPLGIKRKGLRIVVTGGAGFVGSHLVDRLIARGDSVIVVDNFFTGRKENVMHHFGNPRFELIRHDVVEPLLLEVDQIYHLACPASPVHYKFNPVKTIISFFYFILFFVLAFMFSGSVDCYGKLESLIVSTRPMWWGPWTCLGLLREWVRGSCWPVPVRFMEILCSTLRRRLTGATSIRLVSTSNNILLSRSTLLRSPLFLGLGI